MPSARAIVTITESNFTWNATGMMYAKASTTSSAGTPRKNST